MRPPSPSLPEKDFLLTALAQARRLDGRALLDMRTPLLAFGTDLGNELTSLALQIHGGMGFIEETGAAQHYRDVRIAAIYEGTTAVEPEKTPEEG